MKNLELYRERMLENKDPREWLMDYLDESLWTEEIPQRERTVLKILLAKLENYENDNLCLKTYNLSKEMRKRVDEIVNRKIDNLAEVVMESEF